MELTKSREATRKFNIYVYSISQTDVHIKFRKINYYKQAHDQKYVNSEI